MFHDIVQAHALLNHAQFTSLDVDVKDLSVAKMNPTFCSIAHSGDPSGCAATDKIDLTSPAVDKAIAAQDPELPLDFLICMNAAQLQANGPFDLAQYKSSCAKERANYNAEKTGNEMFDLDHCGKYTNPNDQSVCWAHEGKVPADFTPAGTVISA